MLWFLYFGANKISVYAADMKIFRFLVSISCTAQIGFYSWKLRG